MRRASGVQQEGRGRPASSPRLVLSMTLDGVRLASTVVELAPGSSRGELRVVLGADDAKAPQ